MKVLIVAKTRRGGGACVGGITWEGQSVRLIAADAAVNARAGLEYEVGEVWDLEFTPALDVVPPHVENVVVLAARRKGNMRNLEEFIGKYMPAQSGGPSVLFDGLAQASPTGGLYISQATGLPARSTMFWRPDQPLEIDSERKRIRYRYPTDDGGRALTYVGFQEPVPWIPAGTLLRISLAHFWRPKERPEEELRCYLQLSGWYWNNRDRLIDVEAPRAVSTSQSNSRAAISMETARHTLKRCFGFAEFLPTQREVIARVLNRGDTLAVMPTGGGKSLCFQLPALLFEGLTVVVSPLIALMQDQVTQLRELGIAAAFLNCTVSLQEYLAAVARVRKGEIRIVYAAPETLLRPESLLLLEQSRLECLAVDEAHCISEWGHDFRPEYRQLESLRRRFPEAVCLALTATATPRVREDIRRILGIELAGDFVASFNRANLILRVQPRQDGLRQCLQFLEEHRNESGIVYCATRAQVNQLTAELRAHGWPVLPYHAGLDDQVRRTNQDQFTHDDVAVMVATVAFGMGINKANVRFVLHYRLPKDLESYYQEIGRAGRDGLAADCLLLHSRADATTIRRFIDQGAASERAGRQDRLDAMLRYAEASGCRCVPLLGYFGESPAASCGHCDYCLSVHSPAPLVDMTDSTRTFLACVQQTGAIFGAAHIIEVLRGSRARGVLSRGHDRLSTYGTGRGQSVGAWQSLVQTLIQHGVITRDLRFGTLHSTASGWKVLEGERLMVHPRAGPGIAQITSESTKYNQALFDQLRVLRWRLARDAQVPAYLIFSDRTLLEMAAHQPRTEAELRGINGIGEIKLARYGAAFLQAIREHDRTKPAGP